MKSEALVFTAPNQVECRAIDVREPGNGEVLVAVAHSCVSPGTESRVLAGSQVNMPALPVVPGYSAAGVVEQAGPDSRWSKGDAVFLSGADCADYAVCWGAHQRHVVVEDGALAAVPGNLRLFPAAAAKLAAIAEHGARLAEICPGERVAVLGLGPIGFFAALCAQARGAEVSVGDLRESRRDLAGKLGLTLLDPDRPVAGFDVVIDATGAAPAMSGAIALLREKPWDDAEHATTRFVVQGSYAKPPVFPYDDLFWKEPRVLVPRDNQRRDIEAVLGMMNDGRLSAGEILSEFGSPSQASEAYEALARGDAITGCFSWR